MQIKTMKKQLSLVTSKHSAGNELEEPTSPSNIGDQQILSNNLVASDKLLAMSDVNNESMAKEDDNLLERKVQNIEKEEDQMDARTLISQKSLKDKEKEMEYKKQVNASKTDKIISNVLKAEDRSVGNVTFATKMQFFKMMGGIHFVFLDFLFLIGIQILNFIQQYKMQSWASKDEKDREVSNFLWIIVGFTLAAYALTICRQCLSQGLKYFFTKKLHFAIHLSLIYASVNMFWDRVPIGRIVNRVSSDTGTVENQLIKMTGTFFLNIATAMQKFFIVTFTSTQWLWVAIVINLIISTYVFIYFMKAKLECQRVNAMIKSPVNHLYNESQEGVTMIRVFGKKDATMETFYKIVNMNRSCRLISYGLNSWLDIRFRILSLQVVIPGFVAVILTRPPAGLIAIMITNILQISENISSVMNRVTRLEVKFVSWERCLSYLNLDPEAGYTDIAETKAKWKRGESITKPKKEWYENPFVKDGDVSFEHFTVKYRPDQEPVLKDISQKIDKGLKIGVVGRTGAGKSTFLNTLIRTFETYEGNILIDGKNIARTDLKRLRSSITFIPQDPHLFEDSLKKNLDPFDQHKDEDIIKILMELGIWEKFTTRRAIGKASGLQYRIENNSKNFSVGEKQLLCMARALLKKSRLILLDEATANIDQITEGKIQTAIEANFQESTILMIAHRLNTIMFCDKIMVLDKGNLVEFDTLERLKADPKSVFGKMVSRDEDIKAYMK